MAMTPSGKLRLVVTLCREHGFSRLEDIELFLLVCEHPGFTTYELMEVIYDAEEIDRGVYSRFVYGLKKLAAGVPRKIAGLELIDLSERKKRWGEPGPPPLDIKLTKQGKKLKAAIERL